jgi:hypothetical protein
MMRLFSFLTFIYMIMSLSGCAGEENSNDSTPYESSAGSTSGVELTTAEYNSLSTLERYAVINKLMGALYKGTSAADFFDFSGGLEPLKVSSDAVTIGDVRSALQQPMVDKSTVLARIDEKYNFHARTRPLQYPLAMLFEFPLSREYLATWMAYRLANTILFSPAVELETVYHVDIHRVFQRLVNMIENGDSIRDIVYAHMVSQENWRRFRSPEDNTREMMEIFLGRFQDEEVPQASTACRNWSLTDDSQDYQLLIGYDENTHPQQILGTTVTTCTDFYMAVANHGDLIPRITSVVVENLLNGSSANVQKQVVDTIVSENPRQFEEIFLPIIFSRQFLLDTERPAQAEELFFNIANRISWWAYTDFFYHINLPWDNIDYPALKYMKQAPMTYKLGRPAQVPLDTLSFSYFHKAVRERLLLDRRADLFNPKDGGWQVEFIDLDLSGDDFIKYLFIGILSRWPTDVELSTLRGIFEDRRYASEDHALYQALITMDYISRLSETYYLSGLE